MKKLLNINDFDEATQHKLARMTIYKEFEAFEEVLKVGIENGRDSLEESPTDKMSGAVLGIRQVLSLLKDANDTVNKMRMV